MGFAPIRISVLRGDQKIAFDCYLEVAGRHILYLRKGDSFDVSRIERLREKKVRKLYIREDDEQLYRDYMSRNIDMAYDKTSKQSMENRALIVQGVQQSAAEAIFENPTDQAFYTAAKEGTERFTKFLLEEDKALKSMLAIENQDQNLAHHGVTVASLSVQIAKLTGFDTSKNLPIMALGGLIHDLGHYISGQNVSKPRKDFTPEEMAIYKEHASVGAKKLKDLKHMDLHVTQIILEHEETIDGLGFPDGKVELKMNPMSVFVQSANIFDRLVTFENCTQSEAVKRLFTGEFIGKYPLSHLNALKTIVHAP